MEHIRYMGEGIVATQGVYKPLPTRELELGVAWELGWDLAESAGEIVHLRDVTLARGPEDHAQDIHILGVTWGAEVCPQKNRR